MIYLAAPYSHSDQNVVQQRINATASAVATFLSERLFVIAPVIYGHSILQATENIPNDWNYWEDFCTEILRKCSEMCVLMLDGWKESTGVQAEIKKATELGIPIQYFLPR